MKFKDLKDAVSGETVIINGPEEYIFIGFTPNRKGVILYLNNFCVPVFSEEDVRNFKIKKPNPELRGPYWRWEYMSSEGVLFALPDYSSNGACDTNGSIIIAYSNLDRRLSMDDESNIKWKRKIGNPVYINDETGIPCDENGEVLT